MRGTHSLILILTILMLAVPAASAEWAGRGFYEPDHARDKADGYMFADADNDPDDDSKQVYFNIYATQFIAGGNPNSATTGSAIMPYPTSVHAWLGVWKDCNDDGYIGFPETALMEYRTELLLTDTICPTGSPHNDGEWVQEFLWIGPDNAANCNKPNNASDDVDPYNLIDNCARVWADFGQPEQAGTASCPVNPRPRGTYQSTGGFLRFVDCLTGWKGTGAVNDAAHDTGNDDLAFDDAAKERPDQSASPLNQPNPYGQPSDGALVYAFDCSNPTVVRDPTSPGEGQRGELRYVGVRDPTGLVTNQSIPGVANVTLINSNGYLITNLNNVSDDEGIITSFGTPMVPSLNPNGSPAGTVNETLEATALGDCDRSEGVGENSDIYDLEEEDFSATGALRRATDFYMFFRQNSPRGDALTAGAGLLGPASPSLLGEGILGFEGGTVAAMNSPLWFGQPGYVASRNPYVNRDTLTPWGAVEITGFASVSEQAIGDYGLSMPAGPATLVYGAAHCSGTTPITGAWDCNRANWWEGQAASDWYGRVGDQYNLRDIDCWDTTVARGTPSVPAIVAATDGCSR